MNEYMTYKEVIKLLSLKSYKGLNTLVSQGLPVVVIGNTKRIRKSDIDKFMADHTVIKTKEAK